MLDTEFLDLMMKENRDGKFRDFIDTELDDLGRNTVVSQVLGSNSISANIFLMSAKPDDVKMRLKRTDFTADKYTPFDALGHLFAKSTYSYPRENKIVRLDEKATQNEFNEAAIPVAEQIKTVIDQANTKDSMNSNPLLDYIVMNSFQMKKMDKQKEMFYMAMNKLDPDMKPFMNRID